MALDRWYTSQLAPNTEMHSISLFRRREKVAKVLENRNTYTRMMEDEAISKLEVKA